MMNTVRRYPQFLLALAAILGSLLVFGMARARTASAFSYDYCINVLLYPGQTCNDPPFLLRTWNRGWSTQSGAYPCVYFLTAAGNKRGNGTTLCNSGSVSMCLQNPSPASSAYVVNGANTGGQVVFRANTDNSPNHSGLCY